MNVSIVLARTFSRNSFVTGTWSLEIDPSKIIREAATAATRVAVFALAYYFPDASSDTFRRVSGDHVSGQKPDSVYYDTTPEERRNSNSDIPNPYIQTYLLLEGILNMNSISNLRYTRGTYQYQTYE
jgi:hypothetical protein